MGWDGLKHWLSKPFCSADLSYQEVQRVFVGRQARGTKGSGLPAASRPVLYCLYFVLFLGSLTAGPSPQQFLLLQWREGQWGGRVPGPQPPILNYVDLGDGSSVTDSLPEQPPLIMSLSNLAQIKTYLVTKSLAVISPQYPL